MKIAIDLIYFYKENYGGISRVWSELIKRFKLDNKLQIEILNKKNSSNIFLKELFPEIYSKKNAGFSLKNRICNLHFLHSFFLSFVIPRDIEIFHSTGFSIPLFKRNDLKLVTTIHDMVFWEMPDRFKKTLSYWDYRWGVKNSLIKSDQIIAVSHSTKESIIKYFPETENKIAIIYNGISKEFLNVPLKTKKEKFFLFVGARNEYKNFNLLLEAFSKFHKKNNEYKLYVVGENNKTRVYEKMVYQSLGISDVVKDFGPISQEQLIGLMQCTSAVIIPSLSEGFNLPMIEAFACGAYVLSSDIPVSREIGKEFALFFENNKFSLLDVMSNIGNLDFSEEKLSKMQKYAKLFNWDDSYKKLNVIYEGLIEKSNEN